MTRLERKALRESGECYGLDQCVFECPLAATSRSGDLRRFSLCDAQCLPEPNETTGRRGDRDAGSQLRVAVPFPNVSNPRGDGRFMIGCQGLKFESLMGVMEPRFVGAIIPQGRPNGMDQLS